MHPVVDTRIADATDHDPELVELAALFGEVCEKYRRKPTDEMIEAGILAMANYDPREDSYRLALTMVLQAMLDHE